VLRDILSQNLLHSWRHLRRKPSFCIVVIATLALGIGVNTAIFSLTYGLLLCPFPYTSPDQLVRLRTDSTRPGQPAVDISVPDLYDYRAANRTFVDMGIFAPRNIDLVDGTASQSVNVALTTPGAFNALAVEPLVGRTFLDDEDRLGGDIYKTVLSYELWQARYGRDPNILGKQIRTPIASYTVIGIMPPGKAYPSHTEMWIPLQSYLKNSNKDWITLRGSRMYYAIGRLRPGVTIAQAQADLDSISDQLAREYPNTNKEFRLGLQNLRDAEVGTIRPYLLLLLGAAALVLTICVANIANLSLAAAADRAQESVIRTALGASSSRLVSLFLTESVLLAVLGGVSGLLIAIYGVRALPRLIPTPLPSWVILDVNWAVFLFNLLTSVAVGIFFGLAPALFSPKDNLTDGLRQGARTSARGGWLRNGLIVAEVCVCFTLLVGAGLLLKNFDRLRRVNPGFSSQHLLTFKLAPYQRGKNDEALQRYVNFYNRVLRRLEAVPGVLDAGAANAFPFEKATLQRDLATIGVRGDNQQERTSRGLTTIADVTPTYFQAMGIPLRDGRYFNEADTHDKQQAVVISERTARTLFPNRPAVGQQIRLVYLDSADPWGMVVGVVGDVKYTATEGNAGLELYYPYTQYPVSTSRVAVRFEGNPSAITQAVRQAMAEVAPDTAVSDMRLMDQLMLDTLWQQRLWGFLLGGFAGLALLLSSVGLYGVISYVVKQKTFEFGIRLALGASRRNILSKVTLGALRLVSFGLILGFALSLALTRTISSLLVAVTASDPVVLLSVPLLLTIVALAASLLPGYRAISTQPWKILRNE
jgi:putative ABC transport system permease protein